jgi:hypothetical protein
MDSLGRPGRYCQCHVWAERARSGGNSSKEVTLVFLHASCRSSSRTSAADGSEPAYSSPPALPDFLRGHRSAPIAAPARSSALPPSPAPTVTRPPARLLGFVSSASASLTHCSRLDVAERVDQVQPHSPRGRSHRPAAADAALLVQRLHLAAHPIPRRRSPARNLDLPLVLNRVLWGWSGNRCSSSRERFVGLLPLRRALPTAVCPRRNSPSALAAITPRRWQRCTGAAA